MGTTSVLEGAKVSEYADHRGRSDDLSEAKSVKGQNTLTAERRLLGPYVFSFCYSPQLSRSELKVRDARSQRYDFECPPIMTMTLTGTTVAII